MARYSHATRGNAASWWPGYIRQRSRAYGLDPRAVLAVSSREGLSGGVGDAGTSFGPFQLHVGGALPRGKGRGWAESRAGIDYALRQISGVARGLTGRAAIQAIVTKFERPAAAHVGPEIAGAWDFYNSGQKLPGGGAHSPMATGANDATGGLRPIGAGTNDQTVSFLLQRAREHAAGETPTGSLLDLAIQRRAAQAATETFGDKTGGTGTVSSASTQDPVPHGAMTLAQAAKIATKMGLHVSEYAPYGAVHQVHVKNSYHYSGRAFDASGSPAAMARYYRYMSKYGPTELFYDPLGGIKNGHRIGAIGHHQDHVHTAF